MYGGRDALSEPSHIPFIANGIFEQKNTNLSFDHVLSLAYNNSVTFFGLENLNKIEIVLEESTSSIKKGAIDEHNMAVLEEDFDIELELND